MAAVVVERTEQRPDLVAAILQELPEWFGIEEANAAYIDRARELPTYTASTEGEDVGVLLLENITDETSEMHLLAVRRRFHRGGAGRALVEAAERDLRDGGREFIQVKTLGASHPSQEYDATRRFYEALRYRAIEEFPADTLWPGNPCLLLVKHLSCV